MSDSSIDIDDVRYQHHLNHRGTANQRIFWVIWACIAAFVLLRLGRAMTIWWSRRVPLDCHLSSLLPTNDLLLERAWSFIHALAAAPFPQKLGGRITTLPSGHIIGVATYMMIVVSLLFSVDAPASTPHFVDDVAFRAAWITVTQIPLAFLLSTKRGPVNFLAKVSYDRLIWLHKWVGRMIFVSATTHVAIMKSSISFADIFLSGDKGATVVRHGIASYFLLIWIAFSSILPLRKWSYRAFYINHSISPLGFLIIAVRHVPKHAKFPIFLAVGFVLLDKFLLVISFVRNNISVRALKPHFVRFRRAPGQARLVAGYPVEMLEPHNLSVSAVAEESTTTIRICNLPIKWRPGQHIRLYLPALGPFEIHPFEPANCANIATPPPLPPRRSPDLERRGSLVSASSSRHSNDVLLLVRAHSGLTRRLKDFHTEWLKLPCPNATLSSITTSLTAYVDGPYGHPPSWEEYENLLLISTSTGVSFALSVMDYLEQLCSLDVAKLATQTIRFVWIARHIDPQLEATVAELLRRYSSMLRESGVRVDTDLYTTCAAAETNTSTTRIDQFAHLRPALSRYGSGDRTLTIRNPDDIYDEWEEEERQWAELERLEEMQMKEVEPFTEMTDVGPTDNDHAAYEGDGYPSSETSTLLDEADMQQGYHHSSSFSEVRLTSDESTTLDQLRPLSSPVRSPLLPYNKRLKKPICQCALVQYQRQKLRESSKPGFGSTTYATRPDISRIVNSAVSEDPHGKSMVATCANSGVSSHVNKAVSVARLAFARGQRPTDVETFTEGFC